jgi:uncharacterized ferritin-like protein (DUF455 family)
MKLSEYCRQIIFSPNLADKLHFPDVIEFDEGELNLADVPNLPVRNNRISGLQAEVRTNTFPSAKELESSVARATAFHFFANHELLALELMALTILRFPKTDIRFKRSILSALKDEQRHFGLYLQRMHALGMDFGDIPANFYFWNEMKGITSPMQYVAGMSLTFEQANLDFAVHYQRLFQTIGDTESGDILAKVHEDEIAHVTSGLNWLRNWKDPQTTDWQAYRDHLPGHITASRARGSTFDEESRHACGFEREFIDEVMLARQSKGRRPALWVFNAGANSAATDVFHDPNLGRVGQLRKDLSPLMMFSAASNDMVLTPQDVSLSLRKSWHLAGLPLSNFVTLESLKVQSGEMRPDQIQYWDFNLEIESLSKDLGIAFNLSKAMLRNFCDKSWLRQHVLHGLDATPQQVVSSDEDISAFLAEHGKNHRQFVMKLTTSSSGQGHLLFAPDDVPADTIKKLRVEHRPANVTWIMEPWLDRIADFSTHGQVHANSVDYVGATPFFATKRGQYFGSLLGKSNLGVFFKWLHLQMKSSPISFVTEEFKRTTTVIGQRLQKHGYLGPYSVDGLVYRDGTGNACIRYAIEVNVRMSMGRIAFEASRYVDPYTPALFLVINRAMAKRFGKSSVRSFVDELQQNHPIVMGNSKIQSGFLSLSLCDESSEFCACVIAAKSVGDITQRLGYIAELFPQWFLDQRTEIEESK